MEQTIEEQNKKVVNDFLTDPENKKLAIQLAHQISKEVGEHWFDLKKLLKKFKLTEDQAIARITMLGTFSLCAKKEGKKGPLYKIDIDQRNQRLLIQQEIDFHNAQVLILKDKLLKLD